MDLATYQRETGETEAQLAERLGIAQATVNHLKRRTGRPSADLMKRIHDATDGKVTPNDLLGVTEPDPQAA